MFYSGASGWNPACELGLFMVLIKKYRKMHGGRGTGGYVVAQLVEALRFKPEGRGFDSLWCH
jgi:hypothetical protein